MSTLSLIGLTLPSQKTNWQTPECGPPNDSLAFTVSSPGGLRGMPSKVSVMTFPGLQSLEGRYVFAVLIAPPRRLFLLRTTRMFAIFRQRHPTGHLLQCPRKPHDTHPTKLLPVSRRNRHHHARIGLPDLQRQIVRRQCLA